MGIGIVLLPIPGSGFGSTSTWKFGRIWIGTTLLLKNDYFPLSEWRAFDQV
jgi:hypothetical protein